MLCYTKANNFLSFVMAKSMQPHSVGLVVGGLFAVLHFSWAIMVATNVAQPVMDFIFKLHMIEPFYTIMPFSLGTAVGLVLFTAAVGYVMGFVLGLIWNAVQKYA